MASSAIPDNRGMPAAVHPDSAPPPTSATLRGQTFHHPNARHLVLPYASAEGCDVALASLNVPHLRQVLARWHPSAAQGSDAYSLTPPHERTLAQALGWANLPDGTLPWAAWHAGQTTQPCAWFSPCHWNVGMEQVTLLPPDALALDEAHSRTLLQALLPYCKEDGIDLIYEAPGRWRAEGPLFADLPSASLDRVAHRRVDAWLPNGDHSPQTRLLLRLQSEAQMLFYTQPVNDERAARGLPPINGFWVSGSGQWTVPLHNQTPDQPPAEPPHLNEALRQPALRGDWTGWAQAWQALDAQAIRPWLERAERGETMHLTLCGERASQTWSSAPVPTAHRAAVGHGLRHKLLTLLHLRRSPTVTDTLSAL